MKHTSAQNLFTVRYTLCFIVLCLLVALTSASATRAQESGETAPIDNVRSQPQPTAQEQETLDATARLKAFGRNDLAFRRLSAALQNNPTSKVLRHAIAQHYLDPTIYKPSLALELYQALVVEDANDVEALTGVGQAAYLLAGHPGEPTTQKNFNTLAQKHLKEAIELDPQCVEALFLLGEMERLDAFAAAEKELRQQHYVVAQRYYQAALEHDPDNIDALYSYAEVLIGLSQAAQALEQLNAILTLEGDSLTLHEMRGQASLMLSPPNYELFFESAYKAMEIDPRIERQVVASLAKRIVDLNDLELSTRLLHTTAAADQSTSNAQRMEVLTPYLPSQDDRERQEPVIPEFCYLAADATFQEASWSQEDAFKTQLLNQALVFLEAAASIDDLVPDVARLRAVIHMRLAQYDQAQLFFERTALLDPDDPEAQAYADVMPLIDEGVLTLDMFERYLDIRTTRMLQSERIHHLEALSTSAPKFVPLHVFLADLLFRASDFERALFHYQAAIDCDAENDHALLGAGKTLARIGQWAKALEFLDRVNSQQSEELDYWRHLAQEISAGRLSAEAVAAYHESQHPAQNKERREELLESALKLNPEFFEALLERASNAQRERQQEEAQTFGERALAAASGELQRSQAHALLGNIAFLDQQFEAAAEHYQLARKGERDDNQRLANLFWLEAVARAQFGDYQGVDSLLTLACASELPLKPLRPDPSALNMVKDDIAVLEVASLDLRPKLRDGQHLRYHASLDVGATDANDKRLHADFDVVLNVRSSPAESGIYTLDVSFDKLSDHEDFAPLAEANFTLEVSPWFGLVNEPFAEDDEAYYVLLPTLQALCEMLTIAPTKALSPFIWSASEVAGNVHLENTHEVCYLAEHTASTATVRRLGIDRFQDPNAPEVRWQPRHTVDAEVAINTRSGLPTSVSVDVSRSELNASEDDVITDSVKITLELAE